LACNSLIEDKFYEKSEEQLERLRELVKTNTPEYVSSLAVYVREKMYLRSISQVLAVELAKYHK